MGKPDHAYESGLTHIRTRRLKAEDTNTTQEKTELDDKLDKLDTVDDELDEVDTEDDELDTEDDELDTEDEVGRYGEGIETIITRSSSYEK